VPPPVREPAGHVRPTPGGYPISNRWTGTRPQEAHTW
jgi:hypothetical protein